jgi:hypothetical protein
MFYVKESVKLSEHRYWERCLRSRPFSKEEQAINYAKKRERPDNQPFVVDAKGNPIHVCQKGKAYDSGIIGSETGEGVVPAEGTK